MLIQVFKQAAHADAEALGDPLKGCQRDVFLAALNGRVVSPMHMDLVRKVVLA